MADAETSPPVAITEVERPAFLAAARSRSLVKQAGLGLGRRIGRAKKRPIALLAAIGRRVRFQGFVQAEKLCPQPQDLTALGLSNVNPRFSSPE